MWGDDLRTCYTQKHEIRNNTPHLSTRSGSVDKRIVLPSPEETGHSLVCPEIRRGSARKATGCQSCVSTD